MTNSGKPARLESWIEPQFSWAFLPDVFVLDVPLSDPRAVGYIATGICEVLVVANKLSRKVLGRMGAGSLQHALMDAVTDRRKLRPSGGRLQNGARVSVYCLGAFLSPRDERLLLIVGKSKPNKPSPWLDCELKLIADAEWKQHCADLDTFDKKVRHLREKDEELCRRPGMLATLSMLETNREERAGGRPTLTAECLRASLPLGVAFTVPRGNSAISRNRSAVNAIAASGEAPSRDGSYAVLVPSGSCAGMQGLVVWTPHNGLPSYPEIRAALEAQLPAAFAIPRNSRLSRREFDSAHTIDSAVGLIRGDGDPAELLQELSDLRLDFPDADGKRKALNAERLERGFEALAWYQPHHQWTNETWGIYFDAQKLDVLTYSLHQEFASYGIRVSQGFAAFLAFKLTYEHEMFHARVEAALSWLELTAMQPRHLRYSRGVYHALRETPNWLEEALANWTAWDWFRSDVVQSLVKARMPPQASADRVVEQSLDLSPPGYREWRIGDAASTWRKFATQLITGKPKLRPPGIGLPTANILKDPHAYDFQPTDMPLRFIGRGIVADALQTRPASLNVPSRREIERALRHYGHSLDASGGKGGHQKWTGRDQRAFILPTRDPVSPVVFKTFLQHLGIDKAEYVRDIRPKL